MTADCSGIKSSAATGSSGRFLTDRRLKLFFALLLAVTTIIRVMLSVFPKTAITYGDELFYLEIAQNLWRSGSIAVYLAPIRFTKILYSILIAPFYAVTDGMLRTQLISGFNAVLLSSSLIPAWLLARRMLKKNTQIATVLLLFSFSPNLFFSLTFMAENLYLPLLMWAFYALYRTLSADRPGSVKPLLLGFLAFLLYLTKESGASFLFAAAFVFLSIRSIKALVLSLLSFAAPYLILKTTIFKDIGYSYASQATPAGLYTSSQLMYLLYCCLILSMFFLVSSLWYPVIIPILCRRKMEPADRRLLLFSVIYTLALAVGIAYGVLLNDDVVSVTPHIHLRYFLGAMWPFLLLYFQSQQFIESLHKKTLFISSVSFAAIIIVLFYIPMRSSFVEFPIIYFFDLLSKEAASWLWICKGSLALWIMLVLVPLCMQKQKIVNLCLVCTMLVFATISNYTFHKLAVWHESVTDMNLLAQMQKLDQALDRLDGNTLVIAPSKSDHFLKILNTVSNDNYAIIETDDLSRLRKEEGLETSAAFSFDPHSLPIPDPKFHIPAHYEISSIDYIVSFGECPLLDSDLNEDITPDGIQSFHLFKSKDPTALHMKDPLAYTLGEPILFYGIYPLFQSYEPAGFANTEANWTWTASNEVSLTLCPITDEPRELMATWTWRMTNGEQSCEIYANDMLVREEVLPDSERDLIFYVPAESYAETGVLTIRFVFPNAHEPGNGDPRLLAVAFDSLVLE